MAVIPGPRLHEYPPKVKKKKKRKKPVISEIETGLNSPYSPTALPLLACSTHYLIMKGIKGAMPRAEQVPSMGEGQSLPNTKSKRNMLGWRFRSPVSLEKRALYMKGLKLEEKKKFEARHCLQTFFSLNNYTLSWPKSTFGFFISSYGKLEGTFWPTQYIK